MAVPAGTRCLTANMSSVTYPKALLFSFCSGVSTYVGLAAAPHATVTSAIPYGVSAAIFIALFTCAAVAYRNGQPNRR